MNPSFTPCADEASDNNSPPINPFPDEDIWLPLAEFRGAYWVSDLGAVRSSGASKRILTATAHNSNTVKVSLLHPETNRYTQRSVAKLVADAFLPPSKLPLIKHKDGNYYNNAASNLEYRDYVRTNPKTQARAAMPRDYNHELAKINADRRLEAETTRIRSAIRSVQPLTLIEVFGDLVFSFPVNIVTDEALAATRSLLDKRRAVGWEPRAVLRMPQQQEDEAPDADPDAGVSVWVEIVAEAQAKKAARLRAYATPPTTPPATQAPLHPVFTPVPGGGPGPVQFDITTQIHRNKPLSPGEREEYWRKLNEEEVVIPPDMLAALSPAPQDAIEAARLRVNGATPTVACGRFGADEGE